MVDDYTAIKTTLEAAGFFTTFQPIEEPGDRIVCASREYTSGPRQGGLGGNSFWVAVRENRWYVAGWAPAIYHLSDANRLYELCLRLLNGKENRAYFDFSDEVRSEFGLVAVPDEEFGGPAAA